MCTALAVFISNESPCNGSSRANSSNLACQELLHKGIRNITRKNTTINVLVLHTRRPHQEEARVPVEPTAQLVVVGGGAQHVLQAWNHYVTHVAQEQLGTPHHHRLHLQFIPKVIQNTSIALVRSMQTYRKDLCVHVMPVTKGCSFGERAWSRQTSRKVEG